MTKAKVRRPPRVPAYYEDCKQRLSAQAESIIVLAGPSEWVWRSAKNWQETGEWGVLVLQPEVEPSTLKWDVCTGRLVRVWYQASHVTLDPLAKAICKARPLVMIAVDLCSENPRQNIHRWERG